MPALSKKQQKFMGIVRSIQKGEQPASEFSKDAQDAAKDMKKSSVKKFAKTKHKGLPTKVKKEDILNKLKETIREELKDYTYGSGDIVKDVNPSCPHHGAMGKVKSVNPRSVVFVVMNKGKNFKPGMELEKSPDQMKKMNESFTPYRDVGKKTQIASGIVSHWTRILFNELPVKHRNVNGVKKALRVIQQMYMITDHSGVTGMYRVGKRKFMKDVVKKMDKLKESVNEMSAKSKKIINKLNKKEKEMFMDMVDMLGFDQVMMDYKKDKKAFKQALKDMTEGFASAAQRRAAFASGYEAKGKKKKKKESVNEASLSRVSNGAEFSKKFLQGLELVIKQAQNLKGALAKHPIKRDLNKLKAIQKLYKKFIQPEMDKHTNSLEAPDINDIKKDLANGKFGNVLQYNLKTSIEQRGFRGNSFYFLEDKTNKLREKITKVLIDVYRKIENAQLENINEDGHTDVASSKRKVMIMVDDSNKLLSKLNGMNKEDSLPSWWSDKITLSQNYLAKAKDYLLNPVESVNEARLDPKQLLQQLGGNRFIAMTGAKNLAIDKPKNELHMKIGRNAKGVSHVRIRLTSMDLYDMEFLQVRAGRIKIKSKEKGVYADQLGKMFKKNTGMNVRL